MSKTIAFIDASNLFYGGEKSLGWKIDYEKLLTYLRQKYGIDHAFYFGGVEIHDFDFNYLTSETVPIAELERYLVERVKNEGNDLDEATLLLIGRHLRRVRFYIKLQKFGYDLRLKPVKLYDQDDGTTKRKANCDVDMAFYLMREKYNFDRVIILSGDGDFLPLLHYLRGTTGCRVDVMSFGKSTSAKLIEDADEFTDMDKDLRRYLLYTVPPKTGMNLSRLILR